MTYPRPRSLKRWRCGTPAWKRRCDAAIRRDERWNKGKTGYAWMPHWIIPADDMQPVYAAAMEVSLAEECSIT